MVNELIKAISIKLRATFEEGHEIYVNDVRQGLQEPCFLIALLQAERLPRLGSRYLQQTPFDIHYFPKDEANNGEMLAVGDLLMDAMELVTMGNDDTVRGTQRKYEIVDGVLHFFVQYNMHLIRPAETISMETLDVAAGTEKG